MKNIAKMNISRILLLGLLMINFISYSSSQAGTDCTGMSDAEADIKLSGPTITPNPLRPPAEDGIGVMCFYVSNEANGVYAEEMLTLQLNLSGVIAANGVVDISATGNVADTRWEWSYDETAATFTGAQVGEIPADYYEQICIDIVVTEISPQSNKNNGFHALVSIDEAACNASSQNDEVLISTYTQSNAVLPVTLINFEGFIQHEDNHLKWSLADHTLLSTSTIERSVDGTTWQEVQALPKKGLNNEIIQQEYIDKWQNQSTFYRIRFDEEDGSISHSSIIFLNRDQDDEFSVFPNPATEYIKISGVKDGETVIMINTLGQEFPLGTASAGTYNLAGIPTSGTYILHVRAASSQVLRSHLLMIDR